MATSTRQLLEQWHRGCGGYSLTHQMAKHPLFAEIVARGTSALHTIFTVYEHDAWIGWALLLGAITHARPTFPEGTSEKHGPMAGYNVRKLRDGWIAWGQDQGYIEPAPAPADQEAPR